VSVPLDLVLEQRTDDRLALQAVGHGCGRHGAGLQLRVCEHSYELPVTRQRRREGASEGGKARDMAEHGIECEDSHMVRVEYDVRAIIRLRSYRGIMLLIIIIGTTAVYALDPIRRYRVDVPKGAS
jgi:hypothetical protein